MLKKVILSLGVTILFSLLLSSQTFASTSLEDSGLRLTNVQELQFKGENFLKGKTLS